MDRFILEQHDGWYFWAGTGFVGPYPTAERAREKRAEWEAYVLDAPGCHHRKGE